MTEMTVTAEELRSGNRAQRHCKKANRLGLIRVHSSGAFPGLRSGYSKYDALLGAYVYMYMHVYIINPIPRTLFRPSK